MRALGVPVEEVRLSGGGARSPFWRAMCAEMFDARVSLLGSEASGAFGVALLAAVGAGAFASVDAACAATVATREVLAPDAARVARSREVKSRAALAAGRALRVLE